MARVNQAPSLNNPGMSGGGIVPEGAALLAAGAMLGLDMKLWFSPK